MHALNLLVVVKTFPRKVDGETLDMCEVILARMCGAVRDYCTERFQGHEHLSTVYGVECAAENVP